MTDFPPNLSIRPLTIQDLNLCVSLECKGFPEAERASEEKLKYRLTVCPELCSGLFVREYGYKYNAINLPETAKKLEGELKATSSLSDSENGDDGEEKLPIRLSVVKETLIGHIIATKIFSDKITSSSMELPLGEDRSRGHIEQSRTIGVHGLVIDPDWQRKNLGTLLMHDYIQKLSNQDLGSRVVIIAHEGLVPFYEKIGFVNHGESQCKFANECWYDLSIDLISQEE
ncbi:acyl-CoA N-acyltransferase [Metschnikowia bicuspidata var. bicuspidata NRRL YB-4993]|uniref:Acyl-CoA N-acyltransferase n=1 Tax=Metschnikowia bicuspidata var. bicuspidata NRRL YB-4993 TaxID=869754 RepID=A0A1A0HBE4_9ASCO|nr:acyl-CoA N-acyltransferase [Metschnikowia bicuspidata var. bicuspidata NRRL YB-4993]OBA21208.1 acyl-CoA N-acyltransferase [Metschnikowia bicuspidata var. bicuspidata NRRL YB-4993]